jgi:trk system potassium uptake protein TrkA
MYIIIAGCGRVGSDLAKRLSTAGHNVVVIDPSEESFAQLGNGCNCATVKGMPMDEDILKEAGIETADAVIAVTPEDNTNLMTAQIARQLYHVRHVIARAYDVRRRELFRTFGIECVCPTELVADQFFGQLTQGEARV